MGNTGNSDTYPYGVKTVGNKDVVYNRVTGEDVESFDRYGVAAAKKLNALVAEFKAASQVEKDNILAPKQAAA